MQFLPGRFVIASILATSTLLTAATLASAQPPKTASGPAVPGFARFHADGKADPAVGGRLLFGELHCARCHTSGTAADKDSKTAPILDGIGSRIKHSYLEKFINDPHGAKPGTKMPNLLGGLDEVERKATATALAHYLASTGTPSQARPDRKGIAEGRELYSKVGCVACHGTRDAKGDTDNLFATTVPLGDLKEKYTLVSLRTFLENPHDTRPSGRMPGLLSIKESNDVANYLLQGSVPGLSATNMTYSYYEGAFKNLPDFAKLKPKATGETTDFDINVAKRKNGWAIKFEGYLKIEKDAKYTFSTTSDDGSILWINGKVVVNNDGIHPPTTKQGGVKLTKGMHKIVLGFFDGGGGVELKAEIEGGGLAKQHLGPLVYATEKSDVPVATGDKKDVPFAVDAALAAKGKALFSSIGCANCHQMGKEKTQLETLALDKLKGEGGCLSATPKKGVPWFGFTTNQTAALKSALTKPFPNLKDATPGDIVKTQMTALNCYACHERDKIGGPEESLNKFFLTAQPEMGDEGRLPPSLNGVGAKLNPAYLKKIVEQGSHDRPYMFTRMPKFANHGQAVVEAYMALDPAEKAPKIALSDTTTKTKFAARHMVGPTAFGCTKCHTFAGQKAEGIQGIDLTILTQRLQHDWFYNYMLDPTKYRPGTRMPASFPNGKTLLTKVLDGKAETQLEAIWVYLADGKAATPPTGLDKKSIPLVPTTEAIIYRNFIKDAGPRAIAVGFPERAHFAFDANDIRIALIWQGAFMDAKRHWTDRGVGFEPPMGDNIVHMPPGVSFYVLGSNDEAWTTKPAKEAGYRFLGYSLADDNRPTFSYSFNGIKIEDTPNAVEAKGNPTIVRSFTISTENPIDKLYYRAAVGTKIEADAKAGWYRVNEMRIRIEAEGMPIIRQSGNKMELLVPIRFKGNSAKVVQEYVW